MALPTRKTFTWIGAVLGGLGPLLYYTSDLIRDYILGDGGFLWPTGVIVILAYGHHGDFFEYLVIAISIAANIGLFAGIAALVWLGLSKISGRGKGARS